MAERNPYAVLGVAAQASKADIQDAYRSLAKRWHPDLNPGDTEAEHRFKEIAAAYALLSDPEERARLDRDARAADRAFEEAYARYTEEEGAVPVRLKIVSLALLIVLAVGYFMQSGMISEWGGWRALVLLFYAVAMLMAAFMKRIMDWVEKRAEGGR